LIKVLTPEAQSQRRHQVVIQAVNPITGSRCLERLAFNYVLDTNTTAESKFQPELIERLVTALERAHLQVNTGSASGSPLGADEVFGKLDEHGKSIFEYTRGLRRMLHRSAYTGSYREETPDEASELQLGMADLAREQLGEKLSKSLANRLDFEELRQRNILHAPEADVDKAAKRKRLEEGLLHRPDVSELQQRHILQT